MRNTLKKSVVSSLLFIFIFVQFSFSQETVDGKILAQIRTEGFQNSQIMETLGYVTDVFGPRLTNSPGERAAQKWVQGKMTSWGLQNVRLEAWGNFGKGWNAERFSVEMLEPQYDRLHAYPLAWAPGTKGAVSGNPIVVELRSPADFEKYRGKLKNAIVMNGRFPINSPQSRFETPARRFTDEELAKAARETDPTAAGINGGSTVSYWDEERDWLAGLERRRAILKFLRDEGIAALIEPSRSPNMILRAAGFYDTDVNQNLPAFILAREQYARIVRLLDRNIPVRLELNLQTRFHDETTGYNLIGEIPGSDPKLRDEVVILGGHFDSWHTAPGATDNAASCLVMIEAARILKAIGVKPRRTIRVALWSGEEQDYYGSMGYVKKHYGDPATLRLKPDHSKMSVYFNLDNGAGKIRGIFLQGNEAARPIFESWLKPFDYLGASTVTILNTGGSDHMSFDSVGLPGFQFIQDPLDYSTRTHHSNLDVLEAVLEEDLKVNAVIVASLAYHAAMRDEKMPRKALPKPKPADLKK
jgi:carboxypeptidase Q